MVDDLSGLGELRVAAALDREIDDDRAGLHALDHLLGDELGRGPPRDQRRGDDDVLALDVLGNQRGLLLLVGVRHFLGVTAGGLGLLELIVLDRDELRAERGHLFLDRRAHVGGGDDGAEPPRRGDGLETGDADAHDEDARGRHRARRRHHHRQRAAEFCGRVDDGLVAGEVRLRGQHVHALRAGDARHQLHGEERDARLGKRTETLGIGEGIEHADHGRALPHVLHDLGARAPDRQHDVGICDSFRVGLGDFRPGRPVILIGKVGPGARPATDCDARARLDELLDRLGRQPDARLVFGFGGHANRDHRGPGGSRARRAQATAQRDVKV